MPEDKDKQPGADAPKAADQKSDKSPEELMAQVSQGDDSLDPSKKKSAVDAMADETTGAAPAPDVKVVVGKQQTGIKAFLARFNIYFLIFILITVAAGAYSAISYTQAKREEEIKTNTTALADETLEELKTSDAIVGNPKQVLTIESNAIITGKAVIKSDLDVAGTLKLGGQLTLPSLTVTEDTDLGRLSVNSLQSAGDGTFGGSLSATGNLSINGDATINGKLDLGKSLTVNGNGSFTGNVSAKGISFESLTLTRLTVGGTNPSVSVGGGAGGGGTASVQGSDTAGTVTINTGGSPSASILATITFTSAFPDSSPHPVISPSSSQCAGISYYVTNVSATSFAIASASAPSPGVSCKFNYIVIN